MGENSRRFISGDFRNLNILYKRAARYHFYGDRMRTFDYYFQWYMKMVGKFPSMNITRCHQIQSDFETRLSRWRDERINNFVPETKEQANLQFAYWVLDPNKHQIAAQIDRLIDLFKLKSCIEVGCHSGALLYLIHLLLQRHDMDDIRLIGIEPDPMPFLVGKERLGIFPKIELCLGDHRQLREFEGKSFGILMCSFVLCLNDESVVREILNFASKSCRFIVIAEDLSNMFEQRPVIRRHYIIHNYARLLKEYNFLIMDKIFLEEANEAANGILISANRN